MVRTERPSSCQLPPTTDTTELAAAMGFFGMVLKPGQKEAVEVPPGWCLQLCTAALEPAKAGVKVNMRVCGVCSTARASTSPPRPRLLVVVHCWALINW